MTLPAALRSLCFYACLALALALAGCTASPLPEAPPAAQAAETITIGLAVSNLKNPFFVEISNGVEAAGAVAGVNIIVMDARDDTNRQANQIRDLINRPVDVLLINPVDSGTVVVSIEAANEAGIPVLTLDRAAEGGEVVSHIASDNRSGGAMAASFLAETLGKKGKLVEIQGQAGTSAAGERSVGFVQALQRYPNMEVIVHETANFNRQESRRMFARILKQYPEINGVFAHNDEMILGAIEAAESAGRLDGMLFIGFDATSEAIEAVENGKLNATIAQQPQEMGRLGVETALKHLRGEAVSAVIVVDLALIVP